MPVGSPVVVSPEQLLSHEASRWIVFICPLGSAPGARRLEPVPRNAPAGPVSSVSDHALAVIGRHAWKLFLAPLFFDVPIGIRIACAVALVVSLLVDGRRLWRGRRTGEARA